ncbi:MAG: GNAT family N-acetyltransferase [Ardenticatenaceae bacterium]
MEFYPASTSVPSEWRTNRLWLRPLRATDVALDYEAVMSSREQLRRWSQTDWPTDDFTLAQNLGDLEGHEREHEQRVAFTFTVLNPEGTRCLGCVYIIPLVAHTAHLYANATYAANVGFWVRTSEVPNHPSTGSGQRLDKHLFATLRDWFATEWPFDALTFIISQQDTRQAALLSQAGLERRLTFELGDGRPCWLYS